MRYKLSDLCSIGSSKRIYLSEYVSDGLPFYRGKEIIEKSKGNKITSELYISRDKYDEINKKFSTPKKGDILITAVGTLGKVWLADEDNFYFKDGNIIWLYNFNSDKINNRFLYYKLSSAWFQNIIKEISIGSTQKALTIEELKKIEIELPEIKIQQQIVLILDSLNNKLAINNQISDNLLEICNCIFHNFLEKNKDNVVYKKITDIAKKVITGKTPSTSNNQLWNGNIPFITIPDMHNQVFTIETERYITKLGAKSLIPKNSISVSCIATIGLVSINTEESQTNQQINSIIIDKEYDLYYLYEYLSEQTDFMKSIAGGSTTYNINKNMFENMEVPYLPNDEMIKFNNNVSSMFERILENEKENKVLEQLRDALLPKLMNGEIDLETIQI